MAVRTSLAGAGRELELLPLPFLRGGQRGVVAVRVQDGAPRRVRILGEYFIRLDADILPVCHYSFGVVTKSRREEYSEATKQALVDSAVAGFAERGYARTSLDDIATTARVTKGALYHHFDGKQALFEAALNQLAAGVMEQVVAASAAASGAWDMAMRGLETYLDQCRDPAYGRIVLQEGPVALGFHRWQEIEQDHAYGFTEGAIRYLIEEGDIEPLPLTSTAQVAFGMITAAARAVADAPDDAKERVAEEMKAVLHRVLRGLRPSS